MEQFGSGLSRWSPGGTASWEEVAERQAHRRALHPGVQVVDGPEKHRQTRSRNGVSLPQKLHRHRRDLVGASVVYFELVFSNTFVNGCLTVF